MQKNKIIKKIFIRCQAFSLIEAALSLLLIGIFSSGIIQYYKALNKKNNLEITQFRANYIRKSIQGYIARYGFLPCASDNLNGNEKKGNKYGYIPYKTLGISKIYIYDGFGKPFIFGVNEHLTLAKYENNLPYVVVPITQPAFYNNIFRNKANNWENTKRILNANETDLWPVPKLGVHFCRIPVYMKAVVEANSYKLINIDNNLTPCDEIAIVELDIFNETNMLNINYHGKNIRTIRNKVFKLTLEPQDYIDNIETKGSKLYISTMFENETNMPHLNESPSDFKHLGRLENFFETKFRWSFNRKSYKLPKAPIFALKSIAGEETKRKVRQSVSFNITHFDFMDNQQQANDNLKDLKSKEAQQSLEKLNIEPYYYINDTIAWFIISHPKKNYELFKQNHDAHEIIYLDNKAILFYQTRFNLAGQLNHPCSSIPQVTQRVYTTATRHYYNMQCFNWPNKNDYKKNDNNDKTTEHETLDKEPSHQEMDKKIQVFNNAIRAYFFNRESVPISTQKYIKPIENWLENYQKQIDKLILEYKKYNNAFNLTKQKYFINFKTNDGVEMEIDFSYYLNPSIQTGCDMEYIIDFISAMHLVHYVSDDSFDKTDLTQAFKKIEQQFIMKKT